MHLLRLRFGMLCVPAWGGFLTQIQKETINAFLRNFVECIYTTLLARVLKSMLLWSL